MQKTKFIKQKYVKHLQIKRRHKNCTGAMLKQKKLTRKQQTFWWNTCVSAIAKSFYLCGAPEKGKNQILEEKVKTIFL